METTTLFKCYLHKFEINIPKLSWVMNELNSLFVRVCTIKAGCLNVLECFLGTQIGLVMPHYIHTHTLSLSLSLSLLDSIPLMSA